MAKTSVKVELNRANLTELGVIFADGMQAIGVEVIARAHPPDATPYGRGLVQGGGAVTWAGRRKVAGTTIGGRQISKPRSLSLTSRGITTIAGFGFPGRFVEMGTVDTAAQPFLTPAAASVMPSAEIILSDSMRRRLGRP